MAKVSVQDVRAGPTAAQAPLPPPVVPAPSAPSLPPRWLGLLPAALALLLYLGTASPTVNFVDSGELTTVAWTGGIAYPPGYPLYTLISSAFIHVPLGDPAWRMNVLSALFAALAVGLCYGLIADTLAGMPAFGRTVVPRGGGLPARGGRAQPSRAGSLAGRSPLPPPGTRAGGPAGRSAPPGARTGNLAGRSPLPQPGTRIVEVAEGAAADDALAAWAGAAGGLAAAGLLAVSVTFWDWATQAKMYSLHFAFMVGLLWLALRTRRALGAGAAAGVAPARRWPPAAWPPAIRLLHLLALTAGLAMTNHFLTLMVLPGLAILLLAPLGRLRTSGALIFRHTATVVAVGLLPLLLYLYLPLRAGTQPLMDWGSPDNWGDFWRHVTVWQFRVYVGQPAGGLGSAISDGLVFAANQFAPWLSLLLLVPLAAGLVYLWRTDRALLAATALVFVIDCLYTINYGIREIAGYYVPAYIIAFWWVGLGVGQGLLWGRARLLARGIPLRRPAAGLALGGVLALLALAANWGAAGHRDDQTTNLYLHNAFKNFRPNAVVLTNNWDLVSGAYYLQHVLGERPDVAIIDKSLLRYPFYVNYVKRSYPELVQPIAAQYDEFQRLDRTWVDTGNTPTALPGLFLQVLNGLVDSNLGKRPVYTVFFDQGQEEQAVLANRQMIPDGIGLRVAAGPNDRATADPQFDLRGLTSDRVALDEVAYSVVWIYPQALENIGAYLSASGSTAEQKQTGARLQAQAAALGWLGADRDSRPHLR